MTIYPRHPEGARPSVTLRSAPPPGHSEEHPLPRHSEERTTKNLRCLLT